MSLGRKFSLTELQTYDMNNKNGIHYFGLWGKVYNANTLSHPGGRDQIVKESGKVLDGLFMQGAHSAPATTAGAIRRLRGCEVVGELSDDVIAKNIENPDVDSKDQVSSACKPS